ncbi:hypothetical protein Ndes2437A_g06855 [Nannochloris sp. 'desiccata']
MHLSNTCYDDEREMASPFGTAAAQAGQPFSPPTTTTQGVGPSSRRNQDARHADYSCNDYSKQNGSFLEGSRATPTPPTDGLVAPASSLSDLSPFAHVPPPTPSLASSLANSAVSSVIQSVQSDPRSQKSSPIGQSIASAATANKSPEVAVPAAMAAAATVAATIPRSVNSSENHQRNLPANFASPFLNGHLPAGAVDENDLCCRHPVACSLFSVPEGTREGQASTSTDASASHFSGKMQQEEQQQLLQHLFPPSGSSGGGGGGGASAAGGAAPRISPSGHVEPNSKDISTSPVVYLHPSGIPRQSSSSSVSVLSSPPSPAGAAAAVAAAGGAFSRLGGSSATPPYSMGGMHISQEQLQKAALQALKSGQSYSSTQLGGAGGAAAVQPQQQASVADKLMAYHLLQQQQQMQQQQQQQRFPAVPAGVANQPPPLYLQDAALQALQQQPGQRQQQQHQQQYAAMYSPPRRSDSWGQFRGNGSSAPSTLSTTPDRRSLDMPFFSASNGGGGGVAGDNEGLNLLFPAARYSISRDSGGGGGVSADALQKMVHGTAEAEQRDTSAAALLQRVQLSTKNMPKVRALLNTGGKFTTDTSTGNLQYEGGEVRLVSLPDGCTFPQLLGVLAKTERPSLGSGTPTTAARALKGSPRGVTSNSSKDTSSTVCITTPTPAAQASSAAAAAVSALVAAQEAAAATDNSTYEAALDAESYAMHAMHVARAHCLLRYQLPSDPSIFVDIVDDEDVQLMFEEIAELRAFGGLFGNAERGSGGAAPPKLRLFVQWIAPPPGSPAGAGPFGTRLDASSRNNTLDYIEGADQFLSPMYSEYLNGIDNNTNSSGGEESNSPGALTAAGGGGGATGEKYYSAAENSSNSLAIAPRNNRSTSSSPPFQTNSYQNPQHVHIAHRSASELRLAAVRSDQLECIPASEVTLVELLGTGTFGDMYAGKWRECTVAVKCLNPSSVGLNYGSQAAWLAFLNDANSAAALRHPNLVEVYGIVLPGAQDQQSMQQEVQQRSESLDLALKSAGGLLGNTDGGLMIGPKMSGRRTSWDFGALNSSRSSSSSIPAATLGGGGATTSSIKFCAGIQRLPGPCMSTPAMVMEYVSGKSLHTAIQRKDDAVAGVLARILYALDVSRGMAYLLHRGVSHFDLKSTNILLGWRNMRPSAKIAGYGLSTRKASLRTYTPGVSLSQNVFPWVAPEILRNPDKVSHKADIFSFGIVLWELWALRAPYEGMDMTKLVSLAVNTDEEVRPEVPPPGSPAEPAPGWRDLVQQCWNEDPDERPEFAEIEKRLTKMAKEVKLAQRKPEKSSQVVNKDGDDGENVVKKKEEAAVGVVAGCGVTEKEGN